MMVLLRYSVKIVFIALLTTSCTVLQYRRTDKEILTTFSEKNVATEIIYKQFENTDIKIRIQKVASSSNTDVNILFIHGSPSSLTAWRAYLSNDALIERANLYAIDRPGYGYSNFGKGIPSITKQSQYISQIITDLDLKNVITVGSSYGGAIAARTAVLNPEIQGVILVSAAIDPNQEKDIWASRLTQWWLTRWMVPTTYRMAGDEKTIHAGELATIEKDWDSLTIPIMHLHGDIDNIVPASNIEYSKATFSMIETKLIEGVNHDLAWQHPEILIPEIIKFLERIEH